ncbi:galactoside O-acetyltransferase [Salmonella enterica]|nr:galactoside O-acetyltransferase [Salmonella enterica]
MMLSMREKIKKGMLFTDLTEGLPEERLRGKELMYDYNHTRPSEENKRRELIAQMFGKIGRNAWIEPPISFSYGKNIYIGDNFYANFNLTIVDDYTVTIGNNVMVAPNVTISVTGHPVHFSLRMQGEMFSFPVTIGRQVVINPGITIGGNSVIGTGSVVTKYIPPNVVAVSVPCRVLRTITQRDKAYYYRDLKIGP